MLARLSSRRDGGSSPFRARLPRAERRRARRGPRSTPRLEGQVRRGGSDARAHFGSARAHLSAAPHLCGSPRASRRSSSAIGGATGSAPPGRPSQVPASTSSMVNAPKTKPAARPSNAKRVSIAPAPGPPRAVGAGRPCRWALHAARPSTSSPPTPGKWTRSDATRSAPAVAFAITIDAPRPPAWASLVGRAWRAGPRAGAAAAGASRAPKALKESPARAETASPSSYARAAPAERLGRPERPVFSIRSARVLAYATPAKARDDAGCLATCRSC